MSTVKQKYPITLSLLLLAILLAIIWYHFDGNYINLFLIALFVLSLNSLYDFKQEQIKKNKLSSSKYLIETYDFFSLLNLLIFTPHFIFSETNEGEKYTLYQMVFAVIITLMVTIVQFIVQFKETHYIDDAGIHNLSGNLMIDANKIEEIEYHKRKIVFHTENKRNDLSIIRYRLASPNWQTLNEIIKECFPESEIDQSID